MAIEQYAQYPDTNRDIVVDLDAPSVAEKQINQQKNSYRQNYEKYASMSETEIENSNLLAEGLVSFTNIFNQGIVLRVRTKSTRETVTYYPRKGEEQNFQDYQDGRGLPELNPYSDEAKTRRIPENVDSEEVIFRKKPNPAAAKRYINVIVEKLQAGNSAQNKDLIDELKKAPNLNLKKIIWKELEKRGFDEIKNDETLRNEICKNTLLHGSTESIDKLRQEFFDKAFEEFASPHFNMVKEKIVFRVPGIKTGFKRGNVEFLPAQRGQIKITCEKSDNFDLDGNPFTRSLKKRMEKENYLAEAKAELSVRNRSDKDAIQNFDRSLDNNKGINDVDINYTGKEGQEIKTRKAVLMDHRSSSALMVLLRKIVESVFGKKQEKTASNPSSIQNAGLGTNKNSLFHTRAVTQTRAEKNVLKPLQKFYSSSPKGKS